MPKFRCVSSAKPVRTLWVSSAWRCVVRLFVQNAVRLTETRQHSGTIFFGRPASGGPDGNEAQGSRTAVPSSDGHFDAQILEGLNWCLIGGRLSLPFWSCLPSYQGAAECTAVAASRASVRNRAQSIAVIDIARSSKNRYRSRTSLTDERYSGERDQTFPIGL